MLKNDEVELNKIYNENCLEGMKRMPAKSVDMILCDLPYGTTANKWDSIIPLEKLWEQYERIIKVNGAIALTSSQPFTTKLINSNAKDFRYLWVWEKANSTGFQHANRRPLKKHEDIIIFYKKQPTYNPQGLVIYGKPSRRGYVGDNWLDMKDGKYTQKYTNYPTSILKFGHDVAKLHPTQKPVPLFEYLIKTYTNEGETVLDNCMGSGTTAIACINTNRNYIGFELDETYYEKSLERIKNHTTQTDIFDVLEGN